MSEGSLLAASARSLDLSEVACKFIRYLAVLLLDLDSLTPGDGRPAPGNRYSFWPRDPATASLRHLSIPPWNCVQGLNDGSRATGFQRHVLACLYIFIPRKQTGVHHHKAAPGAGCGVFPSRSLAAVRNYFRHSNSFILTNAQIGWAVANLTNCQMMNPLPANSAFGEECCSLL